MSLKIQQSLDEASKIVGITWPLYSFVTSNPLVGFENKSFKKAVLEAEILFGSKPFPDVSVFRQAWQKKEVEESVLKNLLIENGFEFSPLESLDIMEKKDVNLMPDHNENIDRILSKWLAAFLDEGFAEWEMPNKTEGFYKSWRKLAPFDAQLKIKKITEIPSTTAEALEILVKNYSQQECTAIFKQELAALPGWTGYIKHRIENESSWQKKYPIDLLDYLAVRLFVKKQLNVELTLNENNSNKNLDIFNQQYLWLKAWELSFQKEMAITLQNNKTTAKSADIYTKIPDAQLALCIDTRSESMRRHIENVGNYETFGYAGFFGIAMDYKNENDGVIRKACPPIVGSAYLVSEIPQENKGENAKDYEKKIQLKNFRNYFLSRLKNMLPSAFGYVEGSGVLYGFSLLNRTLFSATAYRRKNKNATHYENIYQPKINNCSQETEKNLDISLEEKVAIVKGAFDLTGWKNFARIIVFVGHGSHSANNPFGSSLDCGACAASPGRHNARMLAKIANQEDVRNVLKEQHGYKIPRDSIFIGAEHNTTTDEIVIFDSEVPHCHTEDLKTLKNNLKIAQTNATMERLNKENKSVEQAQKNANNWAETRPEWGLAKNAGFIVGPRHLTKDLNLEGRCFLHSYDWKQDMEGAALEGIMQGPMVVTQWINNHYYFATVDNETFGGGSKITHNITGKFGVVQGNGGDLKMGIPLESVKKSDSEMYHQPLRLSVIIQAPIENLEKILEKNENLRSLIKNEWIYLLVMDPEDDNRIKKYTGEGIWEVTLSVENNIKKNLSKTKVAV